MQDRVILGTDYPFPLGELQAGSLIESMDDFDPHLKVIDKFNFHNASKWSLPMAFVH